MLYLLRKNGTKQAGAIMAPALRFISLFLFLNPLLTIIYYTELPLYNFLLPPMFPAADNMHAVYRRSAVKPESRI